MINTEEGFKLESTGKEILTYGTEGLSLDSSNQIRVGYDSFVDYYDHTEEEYKSDFTAEEKKEMAKHVIAQWANFAGLSVHYT